MKSRLRITRLVLISLLCTFLAAILGVQAASSVLERQAPEIAVGLNPHNGAAWGRKAFADFTTVMANGDDIANAAQEVGPLAKRAHQRSPLNPQAHALLAMAQIDDGKRSAILEQALKLNRRSLALQGLSLKERARKLDFAGTVETLDQILRVHPESSDEFYPVLAQTLAQKDTIPSFERIFATRPPWQDRFLRYAAGQPASLVNAAKLRREVTVEDDSLDQHFISRLSSTGLYQQAYDHYEFVTKDLANSTTDAWSNEFPPIDWRFSDTREMRAQLSRDGKELDIFVQSGAGGILLERIVPRSRSSMRIIISHDITPVDQIEDMRLQIFCAGQQGAVFDADFASTGGEFEVEKLPPQCEFLRLAIYGRSWTARPALRGSIQAIKISSL